MSLDKAMPRRVQRFEQGCIYHVFNKTIDSKQIFVKNSYCYLFRKILFYYRSFESRISYSYFKNNNSKISADSYIYNKNNSILGIIQFCLMPNHFHLLLKQTTDVDIGYILGKVLNSFTKIVNKLEERDGPIFIPQFKAKRITTDAQLKQVSRYIHLNPYVSGLVKTIDELENYKHSSYKEYVKNFRNEFYEKEDVLGLFNNSKELYRQFMKANIHSYDSLKYLTFD
jgi:putative transposase